MLGPIVVVGTGRSGTSTVARLLATRCGVRMVRDNFLRPDRWNPLGYFEDRKMKTLVKKAMANQIDAAEFARLAREWLQEGHDIPWGFKVTQICHLRADAIAALDPAAIIVCVRERLATAHSMATWRVPGKNRTTSAGLEKYDLMVAGMLGLLHGRTVLWLDFSESRDEADLLNLIIDHLDTVTLDEYGMSSVTREVT